MYPLNFFTLFPPFPRENKVFVAMSFDDKFERRWKEVIIPAVQEISDNGTQLEPYRVDMGKGSDSIPTDIISGIGNCFLFFADLTTIGQINQNAIRNGNVMYEIGIAQAVRLPEEVILFRSDNDPLLFDLANTRVNYYDPDNEPEEAKNKVNEALKSTIKEIDLQKHLSVHRAVDSLTHDSCLCLINSVLNHGIVKHPIMHNMGDALSKSERINSIHQLLELGILSTQYPKITSGMLTGAEKLPPEGDIIAYQITSFGKAVIKEVTNRVGCF